MKFNIKLILNSLNSNLTTIYNKNIIDIESHNNIFFDVYKDIIIRFNKK